MRESLLSTSQCGWLARSTCSGCSLVMPSFLSPSFDRPRSFSASRKVIVVSSLSRSLEPPLLSSRARSARSSSCIRLRSPSAACRHLISMRSLRIVNAGNESTMRSPDLSFTATEWLVALNACECSPMTWLPVSSIVEPEKLTRTFTRIARSQASSTFRWAACTDSEMPFCWAAPAAPSIRRSCCRCAFGAR